MVVVVVVEEEEQERYFVHLRYYLFLFPNRINLNLYKHDELWMYEINFVINHNLVYLHNVILGYVQEIANRKKKKRTDN